jgi:aminoglycoside/choline kinase family phosphotransferase
LGENRVKTAAAADRRLEDYLASRGHRGAAVEALAGDASTRRYYRVSGPGLAAVVSVYPEPFTAGELPFSVMQRMLLTWGIPTPRIEDEDPQRGIVVQQDLGDRMLQSVLADTPQRKVTALYKTAISDLARLQLEAGRGPQTAACFGVAFDIEKLSWELHYFVKHFLEGLRERDLGVGDRSALGESFHGLSAEIASWPQVLCHRDFHSRNLMLHEGLLYWIDFQDARMGPATYDLVSLLKDSYVDLEKGAVAELAEGFRQKAVPGEERGAFMRRFDLTAVQRNLKALGTFGYMATVRANPVYLQYVPRTLAHLRANLARHPEQDALRRVLARHIEELA